MGVGVEGEGDGGVAEAVACDLWVDAGAEHERSGSMAEVVEAERREAGFANDGEVATDEVASREGFAERAWEDEVVVGPGGTKEEALFELL